MNKTTLYLIAALIWGIPGIIISVKGFRAYLTMVPGNLWWLLLITVAVIAGFYVMFSRIVDRYSARIASLPQKTNVWQTFPLRGWILVICMTFIGGFAFSCLWAIHEMFLQEKRVLRGWFPENPARHEYYETRRLEMKGKL